MKSVKALICTTVEARNKSSKHQQLRWWCPLTDGAQHCTNVCWNAADQNGFFPESNRQHIRTEMFHPMMNTVAVLVFYADW